MLEERRVSLFRNGRNRAVRIPSEFVLAGTQALMRKEGDSLVITPIKTSRLPDLLAGWQPLADDFADAENLPVQQRDIF